VFTARYGLDIYIYNCAFCPRCIYVFCVDLRIKTAIISLYSMNWLAFITETKFVYCSVRTEYIYIYIEFCVLPTLYLCVLCGSENKNSDYFPIQHELAGFHNRDEVCLLPGTD